MCRQPEIMLTFLFPSPMHACSIDVSIFYRFVFVGKISSCWGWSVQVPVAIVLLISPLYFFEIHRWSGDLETHADTKRQRRWQTCNHKGLSAIVAFLFSFKWKTELGCSSFMAGNWVEGIAFSLFYNFPFFLLLCHLVNWCTGKQYLPK